MTVDYHSQYPEAIIVCGIYYKAAEAILYLAGLWTTGYEPAAIKPRSPDPNP
jgi:hypothetical protein